jgi:two-component system, OmpR family, alkaline phosphatase synthesis response regulator PhoP
MVAIERQTSGRVLVVEDTPDLREAMALLLRTDGHDVVVAENGRAALEVIAQGPRPDVALVDLLMPEMDGPSFVERLRGDPELAAIRIVVVTAVASPHVQRLVRADAHVFKPFDSRELLQVVRGLIPEARS